MRNCKFALAFILTVGFVAGAAAYPAIQNGDFESGDNGYWSKHGGVYIQPGNQQWGSWATTWTFNAPATGGIWQFFGTSVRRLPSTGVPKNCHMPPVAGALKVHVVAQLPQCWFPG